MTSPVYIGTPPTFYTIPVTLGADRVFTVERTDGSGNPLNWDATVQIAIDIDKCNPTLIAAVVTDNQAVITIPYGTCDLVKNQTRWRLTMTQTDPTITTALAVGNFQRDDG